MNFQKCRRPSVHLKVSAKNMVSHAIVSNFNSFLEARSLCAIVVIKIASMQCSLVFINSVIQTNYLSCGSILRRVTRLLVKSFSM